MKTIEINLYQFNELSESAKQTAIEWYRSVNLDYDWWEFIYDDAKESNQVRADSYYTNVIGDKLYQGKVIRFY